MKQWLDGIPVEKEALLDTTNRAFQYGDGLFETIAIKKVQSTYILEYLDLHLERLKISLVRLKFPKNYFDVIANQLTTLGCEDLAGYQVLKLHISRQGGHRGYWSDQANVLNWMTLSHYKEPAFKYSATVLDSTVKASNNQTLAGIKHLNRLENVLARQELAGLEADECLLFDQNDCLIEGSMVNVFCFINGKWCTPLLNNAGVEGVKKRWVLQQFHQSNESCIERKILRTELDLCEAMFLTNSLLGICTVKKYNSMSLDQNKMIEQWQKQEVSFD